MLGTSKFRVGTLFKIPVEVDASWFFVFFLVAYTLTTSYFPEALPDASPPLYVALALGTALAFFASIVLHELAHSLVARAGGLRIARVTLFMFGGVSQMEEEPRSPGHELLMAIAGPAVSAMLAACGWLALSVAGQSMPGGLRVALEYLTFINVSVAVFNLLPGFPLDGGRVLRALLWAITRDLLTATRWATRLGRFIGHAFVIIAVIGVLRGTLDLIWLALIGWFIATLASAAYQQQLIRSRLSAVPLGSVMSSPVITVPSDTTIERFAHAYLLGGAHSRYPVVQEGRVIGLVEPAATREVAREHWSSVTVGDLASRDLARVVATPDVSVASVLPVLEPSGPGAVLVVQDGRLAGIVTRADVIALLARLGERP